MELIKIKTTKKGHRLVSARDLYIGLGLNVSHWAKWANKNVVNNDFFKENRDWVLFAPSANKVRRGSFATDYMISLEFAKHLAMMARTEKSHLYRNYFIECEKVVNEIITDKDKLFIEIGRGGIDAIEASKKLLEIETAEIKQGEDKRLTTTMVVEELKSRNIVLDSYKITTTEFHKWLVSIGFGQWRYLNHRYIPSRVIRHFEPNTLFINNIVNKGYAVTGRTASGNHINKIIYFPSFINLIQDKYIDSLICYIECVRDC